MVSSIPMISLSGYHVMQFRITQIVVTVLLPAGTVGEDVHGRHTTRDKS